MDRTRRSPIFIPLLFASVLAATMLIGGAFILVPATFKLAAVLLSLLPLALTICAVGSVLFTGNPATISLLWIIIIILAPFLGPLLWFAWGRRNT